MPRLVCALLCTKASSYQLIKVVPQLTHLAQHLSTYMYVNVFADNTQTLLSVC